MEKRYSRDYEKNKKSADYVPEVASSLAGLFLKQSFDKGKTIEIPSLGITIQQNKLEKEINKN